MSESRAAVESTLDRFEKLWKSWLSGVSGAPGSPPALSDFLPTPAQPHADDLTWELVQLDLFYRIKAGEPPPLANRYRSIGDSELTAVQQEELATREAEWRESLLATVTGDFPPAVAETQAVPGYTILEKLGQGGMGVVYKAEEGPPLNRVVALKMILAGAHANAEEIQRFRAEAEAIAQLQHANIVQIHRVGHHRGLPFFALEFVAGGSLARKIDGKPQPPREAAEMVALLARAMHAVHSRGLVHRDLKPANILLTADGTPKIGDFGLAKHLEGGAGLTPNTAVLGTPSYMAPEQAAGKTTLIGPAADIHALGAILYEMLTGRPPYLGPTLLDTLQLVRNAEPVPPSRLQPKVPRDLETICLKCLHKDPRGRYTSAQALADDLERFLRHEPVQARPIGPVGRLMRWTRRRPAVAALVVVSMVALVATGVGATATYFGKRLQDLNQELTQSNAKLEIAKGRVEKAQAETEEQRALTDHINRITLADRAWFANHQDHCLRLLEQSPSRFRDWEWNYLRGRCFTGYTAYRDPNGFASVDALAISPATQMLATALQGDIRLFCWRPGETRTAAWTGHKGKIVGMRFSPDGKTLATFAANADVEKTKRGDAKLWDVATGQELSTTVMVLNGAPPALHSAISFHPEGSAVAVPGAFHVLLLDKSGKHIASATDVKLGDKNGKQERGAVVVLATAFSADGKQLAGAGSLCDEKGVRGGGVAFWNTRTQEFDGGFLVNRYIVTNVCYSPAGKLATVGADGVVSVWDPESKGQLAVHSAHRGQVSDSIFVGKDWLATCGEDQTVRLWHWPFAMDPIILRGHRHPVMALSCDQSSELYSADRGGHVLHWSVKKDLYPQEHVTLHRHRHRVDAFAFSPDSSRLASTVRDGDLQISEIETGKKLYTGKGVESLAFCPDGRLACLRKTPQDDLRLDFLEPKTWQTADTIQVPPDVQATRLVFSPDGRWVALHRKDDAIAVYALRAGGVGPPSLELRCVLGGERPCAHRGFRLAFNPDGTRLATAVGDGSIRIWDAATGREMARTGGEQERFLDVAYSPDGKRLAVAGGADYQPGRISLMNAETLQEELACLGHVGPVTHVTFHRNGNRLASSSHDGTVKVWELQSGRELLSLVQGNEIHGLAFSPNGAHLATASSAAVFENGRVRIYNGTAVPGAAK